MESYLDRILVSTRERVAAAKARVPIAVLDAMVRSSPHPRPFAAAIREPGMSLVAEVKRRSPSKGEIRSAIDPAEVAEEYEWGGARCLSVLTEPEFFGGSMADLEAAREATSLPVLRKDFVVDPYQVVEARAILADAVLLIVAALGDRGLFRELAAMAGDLGMAALVEVHDEAELDAALAIEPSLIGVNQRDLRTFAVDTGLAVRLRARIPAGVAVVAESGIATRVDVEALEQAGVEGMLVGESLMRADDPAEAAATLLGH